MSNLERVKHLIKQYQCPGCVVGSDPKCGKLKPSESCYGDSGACGSHVPGTTVFGAGKIYLGFPRGMNKVGDNPNGQRIRLWPKGTAPEWDLFNVPLWYKMDQGNLIVKTVMPRRMEINLDVIEEGSPELLKEIKMAGNLVGELESDFSLVPFDVTPHEDID